MPQVIPLVVAKVATWWAALSTAAKVWAVVKAVATVSAIAYSANQQRRMKRELGSLRAGSQGRTVTFQDASGSRSVIYGTVRTGGNRVFAHVTGSKNEYLHVVVAHAGHEVNAIKDVFLGDELIPLDGSGNATGTYAGYLRWKKYLGTDGQTVGSGTLDTEASSVWTANHRLRGVACSELRFKFEADKWPNGLETVTAVIEGKKLYDPRDGSTVFSRNSALAVRDYLANPVYGFGATDLEIDDDSVESAANICDETVALATSLARTCNVASGNRHIGCTNLTDVIPGLKVTGTGIPAGTIILSVDTAGLFFTVNNDPTVTNASASLTLGDTEARYTCDGIVDTSVAPMDNLASLLGSMAGWAVFAGGKWRIFAGAHRASSASFTLADLRGPVTIQTASSRRDSCNAVKGVYFSPVNKWQPADFPPVRNGTYEVEDSTQARTATADASNEQFTLASAANVPVATAVKLSTTGSAPGGVTAGTVYFWIPVDSTHGKFATTRANAIAGTAVNVTSAGSGTHTLRFGEVIWRDLELPFTTSPSMAQRLAKIELERTRQDILVSLPLKLSALKALAGDVCDLTVDRYGWSAKLFEIAEWRFVLDDRGDAPALGVDIVARETAAGVYDWSSGEETTIDLAPDTSLPDPFTVGTPSGLTLTNEAITQPDGTVIPAIKVSWTLAGNVHIESGGAVEIEYKKSSSSDWIPWAQPRGDATFDRITDVTVGVNYDVRIRFRNNAGVRGSYATSSNHAVVATAVTPADPTAASKTAEGVQTASDGTVTSYLTFNVPALPANAAKQFLMYKRNGDTDWLVAAGPLTNTSAASVTITDLTPGIVYAIATLALSSLDKPSNYVAATSSPFTAPGKTAAPTVPTSGGLSTSGIAFHTSPAYTPAPNFGSRMIIDAPADADLMGIEIKVVGTNDSSSTSYVWNEGDTWPLLVPCNPSARIERVAYSGTLPAGYAFARTKSRSGVYSAWVAIGGNLNGTTVQSGKATGNKDTGTTSGTVAAGDDSRITGAAQKASNLSDLASASTARTNLGVTATGADTTYNARASNLSDVASASSARTNLGLTAIVTKNVRVGYVDVTLSGGSPSETFDIDLTDLGYAAKPAAGFLACIDPTYGVSYDRTSGSSTSTNARCTIKSIDGTNIPATTTPIMFCFTD